MPLLCALLGARRAWLVPVGATIADLLTQHFAGVPWWDVWNNEWPAIVMVGLLMGFTSLAVGLLLRWIARWLLRNRQQTSAA